jgi:preprotein translocase subunit SecG
VIAFITVVHVLVCLALVAIVLLQQGKGADIGAAFGTGASQTLFGSRGAGSFLSKLTTAAAIVFMLTSLTLTYFSGPRSLIGEEPLPAAELEGGAPAPAEPLGPAPGEPAGEPGTETAPSGDVPRGFEAIEPPPPADANSQPATP